VIALLPGVLPYAITSSDAADLNTKVPASYPMAALVRSFEFNEIEADLKRLFLSLVHSRLSDRMRDVNVLGIAHLGSFDLVRRFVNSDGLTLLRGDNSDENAIRYLYRSWMSREKQGRGLNFLRTYIRLLHPRTAAVYQLWHDKIQAYPDGIIEDESFHGSEEAYLTSRVMVDVDIQGMNTTDPAILKSLISQIIPARLVPVIRLSINTQTTESVFVYTSVVNVIEIYPAAEIEIAKLFLSVFTSAVHAVDVKPNIDLDLMWPLAEDLLTFWPSINDHKIMWGSP